jgi:CHAD domain-containing protein
MSNLIKPKELSRVFWEQQTTTTALLHRFLEDPNVNVVHNTRVAVRRSLATISLFPKVIRKSDSAASCIIVSKKFIKATNPVRDCDITTRMLSGTSSAPREILLRLSERRRLAVAPAKRTARSLIECAPIRLKTIDSSARLESRLGKITSRLTWDIRKGLKYAIADPGNINELHAVRKDAKRLRYVLEVAIPNGHSRILGRLARLQDQLGEIRDHDIAIDYLKGAASNTSIRKLLENEKTVRDKKYRAFAIGTKGLLEVLKP